jgi:putative peptidoglycan lipid II flippase
MRNFSLGILSTGNVFLAFTFLWLIITYLGSGVESDAFFLGLTLSQTIISIIGACINNVLTPIFSTLGNLDLRRTTGDFLLLIFCTMVTSTLLMQIYSLEIIGLLGLGMSDTGQRLAGELLKVVILSVPLQTLAQVQMSNLYARNRFCTSESCILISNLSAVAFLTICLPSAGIEAAAWAVLVRHAVHVLCVSFCSKVSFRTDIDTTTLILAWHRAKHLLVAGIYSKSDKVVDKFFASSAVPGTITLLHLVQQAYGAGHQVINRVLVTPVVPKLVVLRANSNRSGYEAVFQRHLLVVFFIGVIGLVTVVFFGEQILTLLAHYGAFEKASVTQLWLIMVLCGGYCIMPPCGFLLASRFYSLGDTILPTRAGLISTSIGLVAKVVLFYYLGVEGLAIGISLHYTFTVAILSFYALKPHPSWSALESE